MNVHTFGAYFGLTVVWIVSPARTNVHADNSPSYLSNVFAWIGTLFLWMNWPSFNGALGTGSQRQRAVTNTVLSLTASALSTFITTGLLHDGKFHAEDALNAALAGGVIMGASADLILEPYAALIVESFAGIFAGRTANHQSLMQLAGLGLSFGLGIGGGLVASAVLKLPCAKQPDELFQDREFWEMDEDKEHIRCATSTEGPLAGWSLSLARVEAGTGQTPPV